MRWPEDLDGWPHAKHSRRVLSKPHRWHVQEMGEGPMLLLLHGAGASTHSWRHVMPQLAREWRVVTLDLPGHGFTQLGSRTRSGLTTIAEDIAALCRQEGWHPDAVIGHSAGGAVALRMAQMEPGLAPRIIGLNAALQNFRGLAAVTFPIMAKFLALTPFTADFFAGAAAQDGRVEAILKTTGSKIDAEGVAQYRRLVGDRTHVNGALLMMAQWSLNALIDDLPKTQADILLLSGGKDGTVPPDTAQRVARKLPNAETRLLPELGHLMHEDHAPDLCNLITAWLAGGDAKAQRTASAAR